MSNELLQLSQKDRLLLTVDSQKGDFRGFEGPFNHLTNGPHGAITVLKQEWKDAVSRVLSQTLDISYNVRSLVCKYPRSAKTIALIVWPPYSEAHIQTILDAEVKAGSIVRVYSKELPLLYAVK